MQVTVAKYYYIFYLLCDCLSFAFRGYALLFRVMCTICFYYITKLKVKNLMWNLNMSKDNRKAGFMQLSSIITKYIKRIEKSILYIKDIKKIKII